MQLTRRCLAVTLALWFVFTAPPASAAEGPSINALWNASDGFGIWIYSAPGSCPDLRKRTLSVLVVGGGKQPSSRDLIKVDAQDIKLCTYFSATGGILPATCRSGTFELKYFEAEKEYRGSYDLVFADGVSRKGNFRAAFCPLDQ